jgi:nucleoid DNA-binding protein
MAEKKKALTKSAVYQEVSAETGLTKKEIASVFDALTSLIKHEVGKKGSGVFTLPGVVKIQLKMRPATRARPGRNPKTGEPMTIPAKPARKVLRARVLKALSETVK